MQIQKALSESAPAEIRYATAPCALGTLLAAAGERGLRAIFMGDDPDSLARTLQDRFPKAKRAQGDAGFASLLAQVAALVETPQAAFGLPLDIQGTAFQLRVWQALREIPAGQTVSYAELAQRIGAPTSARAVARACAANPLAVAVPCHRAVRSDGGLSGYRWGVERKRALLEREARGL
jgi:AraC family transcriptional regulator of adaptative response/methylated-DNA-[protein]-cysteine methyltransferase